MKVNNNLLTYEDNITYDNVEKAWKIVRSSCKNKKAIFRYSINRSTNNYSIYRIFKEKRYKPLPFKLFMIFEPKPRFASLLVNVSLIFFCRYWTSDTVK